MLLLQLYTILDGSSSHNFAMPNNNNEVVTARHLLEYLLDLRERGIDLESLPIAYCETVVGHKGTKHYVTPVMTNDLGYSTTRFITDNYSVETKIESENVFVIGALPLVD